MEPMPLPKKLLSRVEAYTFLGVGTTTLAALTAGGKIPAVKIGRRTLYRVVDLEEFIERSARASSRSFKGRTEE